MTRWSLASRRLCELGVAASLSGACGDSPVGPNTDVGLRVWAEVSPASVSVRDADASLRIRVYVRNPSLREIRVVSGGPPYVFTSNPAESRGLWGSYRIACESSLLNCGPSIDWWGRPEYVFPPRTTLYDEEVVTQRRWQEGGWALRPGQYRVRAWFNGREGESAAFVLLP